MSLTAIGVGMAALAVIGGGFRYWFCDKQCRKSHRPAARSSRENS